MEITRRDLNRLLLSAVPASGLLAAPDSKWGGVQVGLIAPYSFQGTASSAEDILAKVADLGISAIEIQNGPVEAFAAAL